MFFMSFIIFYLSVFPALSQQMPNMNSDTSTAKNKDMKNMDNSMSSMAHPFYTHMGMPQSVGRYSLRFAATSAQVDGKSLVDFDLQFETGITKFAGLLVRLESEKTEIMVHLRALKSKNGMSGFSPLFEMEIPTHEGIYSQVGFSTTLANSHVAFHQVIHYGLREKNFEGSVALVLKVSKNIFLIAESLGEKKLNEQFIATMIGGVKFRLNNNLLLAFGVQLPITRYRDFTSQFILQPDLELRN